MEISDVRKLYALEDENMGLKRTVAEPPLPMSRLTDRSYNTAGGPPWQTKGTA
jgi:hypothetical protein